MNRHMTFMSKQCAQHQSLNSKNTWIPCMSIAYKPMKNIFFTTIIA
jgi:outer membrane receptor for Fe3+-dicitrate